MEQLELFTLVPRDAGVEKLPFQEGGIRKLEIEKFKRFERFSIDFDRITLLVGSNSAGKTSVLQAIRMFFWCTRMCLREEKGMSKLVKAVIPFSDFHLIPAHAIRELAFQGITPNSRKRALILKGTLASGVQLKFRIYASYSTLMVIDPIEGDLETSWSNAQGFARGPLYIPGFFGVVTRELVAHDARLEELLNSGHHNEVLRNIILRLKSKEDRLGQLMEIMEDEFRVSRMDLPFSDKTTEFLRAEYSEPAVRIPLDFVSAGSGFLQVLQVMAHALQNPSPILLLDEPDAHMHHDLQRSFLRILRRFVETEQIQVVMASHSETFLRESGLNEIRVIDPTRHEAGKFPTEKDLVDELSKAGVWPTHLELAEILRTRRVFLLESPDDELAFNHLGRSMYDDWDSRRRLLQIVYSAGSSDATVQRLEYVYDILEEIMPGEIQVAHVRDRDLMCEEAVRQLEDVAKKEALNVFISGWRNLEAMLVKASTIERACRKKYGAGSEQARVTVREIETVVEDAIWEWVNDETNSLPVKVREYNRAWGRKQYSNDREAEGAFEAFLRAEWHVPLAEKKIPWKLVDGKAVLALIRTKLQARGIVLSDRDIVESMESEDFDQYLKDAVALAYKRCSA